MYEEDLVGLPKTQRESYDVQPTSNEEHAKRCWGGMKMPKGSKIRYITYHQVTMSFSIFFLFQFHGFKTCGLLYVEFTQENQKFTTLYIYIL